MLNLAVSPSVEVHIKVFENNENQKERVSVHVKDYGDTFLLNPEKPSYDVHPLLQASINSVSIPEELKLEISIISHMPAGISVGTSASVCVALLGGLSNLSSQQHSLELDGIVSLAHRVETEKLGLQSGIQDQICAAYGGVCFIHMHQYPEAHIEKLSLAEEVKQELEERLSLIYLGKSHSSSGIHQEVIALLEKGGPQFKQIRRLRELAEKGKECLLGGELEQYGEAMVGNNECQRSLHPGLICEEADIIIGCAKKYDAAGWKVNGAGGKGGSLTILGSKDAQKRKHMLKAINSLGTGIKSLPIKLSQEGLEIRDFIGVGPC